MAQKPDRYLKLASDRTSLVNALLTKMEKQVISGQEALLKIVLNDFVEGLEVDDQGNIKNTLGNKRRLTMFESIFNRFSRDKGMEVVQGISEGTSRLINFNHKYFSPLATKTKLGSINQVAKETVGAWLGIGPNGGIQENGYLDTLVKNQTVKTQVKDMMFKSVVGQAGYQETKKQLGDFITGNKDHLGALQKYYRNFAYDTYSIADRTAAGVYAEKLKLNYAVYEGGLIKTSREFCRERNGKVFSREEIAKFDPTEARPPGYDPFSDLGGYGCRHHLNWIPDVVAQTLRPDLKDQPAGTKPAVPAKPEPKPEPAKAKTNGPDLDPATPFDQIPEFKPKHFKPSKTQDEALDDYNKLNYEIAVLNKRAAGLNYTTENSRLWDEIRRAKLAGDDAAVADLTRQREELYGKLKAIHDEADQFKEKQKAANVKFRNDMTEGKEKSPVNIKTTPALLKDPTFKRNIAEAEEFFRVVAKGLIDQRTIEVKGGAKREFMMGGNINVNKTTNSKVIVHELGHVLEYNNHILKAAVDFLQRRTGNNPTKWLGPGYQRWEVYKDGGFYSSYVGKIYAGKTYSGIANTEIVSMGLDRMFSDPIGFYKADPDHFNFIQSLFFNR